MANFVDKSVKNAIRKSSKNVIVMIIKSHMVIIDLNLCWFYDLFSDTEKKTGMRPSSRGHEHFFGASQGRSHDTIELRRRRDGISTSAAEVSKAAKNVSKAESINYKNRAMEFYIFVLYIYIYIYIYRYRYIYIYIYIYLYIYGLRSPLSPTPVKV